MALYQNVGGVIKTLAEDGGVSSLNFTHGTCSSGTVEASGSYTTTIATPKPPVYMQARWYHSSGSGKDYMAIEDITYAPDTTNPNAGACILSLQNLSAHIAFTSSGVTVRFRNSTKYSSGDSFDYLIIS